MAAFHSPESLLDDLGLKAKGDIFALKAFCKRRLGKTSDESSQKDEIEEKKRRLVEQLREEKANKKKRRSSSHKSTKDSEEESPSKKKKKNEKSRRVQIGWLHYNCKDSRYVAVRTSKGGGTRRIDINASANKFEVIARAKQLFFPGGESSHGPASEMQFNLANFKLQNISQLTDDRGVKYPFTVQKYFEVHKLTQARIYLASKRMSTVSSANEETEDISTSSVPSSSLSKTKPQRQDERGRLWRQTYAAVDNEEKKECKVEILDDKEDKEKSLRQEIEDVQRLEALRKTRENRVPPEPAENTERVKISVKHSVEGNVSRFFRAGESMVAVYDWVGSLSLFAENFTLYIPPGRRVDPMEDVAVVDGTLLHMEITNDPIPMSSPESGVNFKGFGFGESPAPFEVHIPSLFSSVDDFDPSTDAAAFPLPDVVMIGDERYEIEISC